MKTSVTTFGICLLFILTVVNSMTIATDKVKIQSVPLKSGKTLYVGGTGEGNYSNIRDAINDATDGDTVFVFDDSSPYYENIIVDKSINLIGENKDTTVIDGGELTNVVVFFTDGIFLSGFTIINCKTDPLDHCAGVRVYTNNSIINNNNICENGYNGIHLECSSKNNVISENYIAYNYRNGIIISKNSNSNFIFNNIIEYNDLGGSYGVVFFTVIE
jgi:nitrous oxidase accessory protein NosD